MLRAAASIGKQVVYSGRQRVIENSGSEGLQSPKHTCMHIYDVCVGTHRPQDSITTTHGFYSFFQKWKFEATLRACQGQHYSFKGNQSACSHLYPGVPELLGEEVCRSDCRPPQEQSQLTGALF